MNDLIYSIIFVKFSLVLFEQSFLGLMVKITLNASEIKNLVYSEGMSRKCLIIDEHSKELQVLVRYESGK